MTLQDIVYNSKFEEVVGICRNTEKRLTRLVKIPTLSKNQKTSITKSLKDLEFLHAWVVNSKETD